jgi:flagellar biosynthetic protein FliR
MLAAFLVFCRVGACFMVLPGMSSARVSPQIRILVALAVSVAVAAFVAPTLHASSRQSVEPRC